MHSLQTVNTNQLSPECDTCSLTDLTEGQPGEKKGAEKKQDEEREARASFADCHRQLEINADI